MRYIDTAVNKEIQFNLLCLEVVKERSVMNGDNIVSKPFQFDGQSHIERKQ